MQPLARVAGSTSASDNSNPRKGNGNYKGFVAGVFSGIGKLTVGHPFDTVKVRLQTSQKSQFSGPLECVAQTVRKEGVRGLYKGATPPLIGWMFMDSLYMSLSALLLKGFHLQSC